MRVFVSRTRQRAYNKVIDDFLAALHRKYPSAVVLYTEACQDIGRFARENALDAIQYNLNPNRDAHAYFAACLRAVMEGQAEQAVIFGEDDEDAERACNHWSVPIIRK